MKKLLVLGASEFQIPLLQQARKMGIYTCVLDINPDAYGVPYADEYRECSLKDVAKALEIANSFMPDGVTAGMCDVAVCTCSHICEALSLPGLSIEVAERSTDKYKMIETFRKSGVPHPEYLYFKKGEFTTDKLILDYPIIIKPVDMAGSRGINLVRSGDELLQAIDDSIMSGDKGDIIIEEYMEGPEVSVELFVEHTEPYVMQITDKLTSGAPRFFEIGHSQPSSLSDKTKMLVSRVACEAARALGLYNCVAHAEIIVTSNGPKMVELGARMGGDGIQQQLIQYSTGINLQEAVIRQAMGEQVKRPEKTIHAASAIRFIPAVKGKVKSIENDHVEDTCVKTIRMFCKQGDFFEGAKDNSGRFGYVISQADTAQRAIEACKRVVSGIKIIVE